jgi:hypothetical protein
MLGASPLAGGPVAAERGATAPEAQQGGALSQVAWPIRRIAWAGSRLTELA